jgi:hypothetical protein
VKSYLAQAQAVKTLIVEMMTARQLQTPERWLLVERDGYAWLIGVLPALPKLAPYITQDLVHSLSTALGGRPVVISNSTGLRYAVLLSNKPALPDSAQLPAFPGPENFDFGIGMRGPIMADARAWQNMLIGGGQGSGKSTFLRVLSHTARVHGWDIYLADPDGHTFGAAWERVTGRPIASSGDDVLELLELLESEIARRAALYRSIGDMPPDDMDAYNLVSPDKLKRVLLLVDEANTVMGDKEIVRLLGEVARRGRKWGLHMVLAAHNWRAKDVSRELSGMLQTRLCFRMADDTGGSVTLDNRSWGLYANQIQRPGRAVLRLAGQYQPIQTYMLDPQAESDWLGGGTAPVNALTEIECTLVRLAIETMGGQFKIKRLAEMMDGRATEWKIRTTAEEWERRGWLTHPVDAVSSRKTTPELEKLAGISAQGT